jgi:hypothetical protein
MMCILNSRFCKNFLKVSGANNILKGSTFDMMHSEINEIKKRGKKYGLKMQQDSGYGNIQHCHTLICLLVQLHQLSIMQYYWLSKKVPIANHIIVHLEQYYCMIPTYLFRLNT